MTGMRDQTFIHPRERVDIFGAERADHFFPELASVLESDRPRENVQKLKICIVTQDFVGPVKNGGIGTAYTYAARALAEAGHDVTVLYSIKSCIDKTLDYWVDYYAELGIRFCPITPARTPIQVGSMGQAMTIAYNVYDWLSQKDGEFDFIHASEWNANVYFCLLAKKAGLLFANTQFVIKCSSPTLWNRIGNAEPIADLRSLAIIYMERKSVELADHVICGSRYLLNWMADQGYDIPYETTYVQPNIFPVSDVVSDEIDRNPISVKEFVFFGRLEPRKGLHFFVDALIQLSNRGFFNEVEIPKITLLGKPRPGYNLSRQINRLQKALGISVSLLDNFNQPQALEYLSSGEGRVAVMPSLMDNSPFGVYECLARQVPFLTSNAGGGKELIAQDDWSRVLFDPTPSELADQIESTMVDGAVRPRPSFNFEKSIEDWMDWHQWALQVANKDKPSRSDVSDTNQIDENPLVSVCLAHHNRGELLLNAVESIESQSYSNIEIVIVDDGSSDPAALAVLAQLESRTDSRFPISIVRQRNKYLGAVRNTGIENAKGTFILFMDDDNEAKPNEVEVFVRVAKHTNADVLSCWSDSFTGDRPGDNPARSKRIVFHGDNLALGLIKNPYGDSNCFVKTEAVKRLGGFTEHYKVGRDDVEFFSRAILSGLNVVLVPMALYWYRLNTERMRDSQYSIYSGLVRVSEPFCQGMHPDLANIMRYAQGLTEVYERPSAATPASAKKTQRPKTARKPKQFLLVRVYQRLTGNPVPTRLIEMGRRTVQRFPFLYKFAMKVYRRL